MAITDVEFNVLVGSPGALSMKDVEGQIIDCEIVIDGVPEKVKGRVSFVGHMYIDGKPALAYIIKRIN